LLSLEPGQPNLVRKRSPFMQRSAICSLCSWSGNLVCATSSLLTPLSKAMFVLTNTPKSNSGAWNNLEKLFNRVVATVWKGLPVAESVYDVWNAIWEVLELVEKNCCVNSKTRGNRNSGKLLLMDVGLEAPLRFVILVILCHSWYYVVLIQPLSTQSSSQSSQYQCHIFVRGGRIWMQLLAEEWIRRHFILKRFLVSHGVNRSRQSNLALPKVQVLWPQFWSSGHEDYDNSSLGNW